jgi:MscS family membrane protein
MGDFLQQTAGPWTMYQVSIGFLLAAFGFIARLVLGYVASHQLAKFTARTESRADDLAVEAIVKPLGTILPMAGVFLGIRYLVSLQPEWTWLANLDRLFRIVSILLVTWMAFRLADAGATLLSEMSARTESKLDDQLVPLARKGGKVFIATVGLLLVAQNLGYSVSGLLAGLGIGGLALAMAAKDTLANLFGSLMIMLDRPFHVGDVITFSGGEGVVEEIGMRSTRVRTAGRTVVSIPNQNLANATVENQSLMPRRRIKFTIGVTYDATASQMQELVTRIEELLRADEGVDPEQIMVRFTEFGASSLDIMVQYFTVTTEYPRSLEVRQRVNLALMQLIEEMGLQFAYPTRTVHLVGGGGEGRPQAAGEG